MEFLLIWVLGNDVIDSGLRYKNAAKCFSESQNAAAEMREVPEERKPRQIALKTA